MASVDKRKPSCSSNEFRLSVDDQVHGDVFCLKVHSWTSIGVMTSL